MTSDERLKDIEERLRELEQRFDALPLQRLAETVGRLDGRLDLRTLVRQQLLRASELSRELADLVGHDPEKGDAGDPDGSGHDRHVHIE
jgi:hypothetical protein